VDINLILPEDRSRYFDVQSSIIVQHSYVIYKAVCEQKAHISTFIPLGLSQDQYLYISF
jgi:hypothetical protein